MDFFEADPEVLEEALNLFNSSSSGSARRPVLIFNGGGHGPRPGQEGGVAEIFKLWLDRLRHEENRVSQLHFAVVLKNK